MFRYNQLILFVLFLFSHNNFASQSDDDSQHFTPIVEKLSEENINRLYETQIADFIINQKKDSVVRNIFHKINLSINTFLDEKLEKDPHFDRVLFSCMTLLAERFPGYEDRTKFNHKDDFDLLACQMFHKIIFENAFEHIHVLERSTSPFKENPNIRGRIERKTRNNKETRQFGIIRQSDNLGENTVGKDFENYFETPYQSGFCLFEIVSDSEIVKHFETIKMPFVCGLSGTVRISLGVFEEINEIRKNRSCEAFLTESEKKIYLFGIAICLVAVNSHSFYEIFYAAQKCDFLVEIDDSSSEAIYNSFIPEEIKNTEGFPDYPFF